MSIAMSVINRYLTALIGQQNLCKSQSARQTTMERLSSGLRLNSSADDAACQAIANRMTAQTTGLGQAQRNANDGISVAQTAEGALNQVNDNLQRIRELTVQAQNDTNSPDDLSSIQDEITQRLGEIDRISEETNFNGVKVLAEDQEFSIQVGANDGEQITMNLKEINAETLGLDDFNVNTRLAEAPADGDTMEIDGQSYNITAAGAGATGAGSTDIDVDEITAGATAGTPVASGTNSLIVDDNGTVIGVVTSGGFGATVGGPVAMGYVPRGRAEPGERLNAVVRGKPLPMDVTALPFVPHRYHRT